MHLTRRRVHLVALGLAALPMLPALCGCSAEKFRVRLFNNTNVTLEPYVVHNGTRIPDGSDLAHGGSYSINPLGFNVAFYNPLPVAAGQPNAIYVQMSFDATAGGEVLTRAYHNTVPPGQEGTDPAEQPALVNDEYISIPADAKGLEIRLEPGWTVSYKLE